jgi:hypothetical protein
LLRLYQQLRSMQGSDQGGVAENLDWKHDAATFTFAPSASGDASLWRRALDFRNQEGTGGAHGRLAHEDLLPEGMAESHPASRGRGGRPWYNTPTLAVIQRASFRQFAKGGRFEDRHVVGDFRFYFGVRGVAPGIQPRLALRFAAVRERG